MVTFNLFRKLASNKPVKCNMKLQVFTNSNTKRLIEVLSLPCFQSCFSSSRHDVIKQCACIHVGPKNIIWDVPT